MKINLSNPTIPPICHNRLQHTDNTGSRAMPPGCVAMGCPGLFWKEPSNRTHPCYKPKTEGLRK